MASGSFSCTISRFSSGVKTFTSRLPSGMPLWRKAGKPPPYSSLLPSQGPFRMFPCWNQPCGRNPQKDLPDQHLDMLFSFCAALRHKAHIFHEKMSAELPPETAPVKLLFSERDRHIRADCISHHASVIGADARRISTAMTFMSSCPLIHRISFRYAPSTFLERPIPKIASRITPRQLLFLSPAFLNGCADGSSFPPGPADLPPSSPGFPVVLRHLAGLPVPRFLFPSRCGKTIFTSYPL